MQRNCNNDEIVGYALRGSNAETKTGNMSTTRGNGLGCGSLPYKLYELLWDFRSDISQVIYSYSTPIAILVRGVWIIPDVRYSATTSTKHQSQLYRLDSESIPWDISREELERVLDGKMTYNWGHWRPGKNWVPGC